MTAPNADTLYTSAFVDVGKEPWVLSLPDMNGPLFSVPDARRLDERVRIAGQTHHRHRCADLRHHRAGWTGKLPAGVKEYKSATALVWILGRIYCTGTPEDYAAVHALQDACKLVPLSAYGKPYTPPPGKVDPSIDMKTAVREQVNALDAKAYFTLLAELMKANPPTAEDAPVVEQMAQIGLVPGQDFDPGKLEPVLLGRIPKIAFDRIMLHYRLSGGDIKNINGWGFTTKTGQYGTNYIQRALITAIGLGANLPEDAVYPVSQKSGGGILARAYDGGEKYVMRFEKGQTPPVNGFWSLTMYDANYFFVANPLNRYSISPRQALKSNPDGSIDLYIQKDSPGADKESNWLPAPAGKFILMLRLYWPNQTKPSILDGSWVIPPVQRAS